jgi:hypothetical protein
MTKRTLVICAAAVVGIAIICGWLALRYVPSPFASVTLRGDTVVAKLRSDVSFGLVRGSTHVGEHISGSESIELRDGESIILGSPRTGYLVTCRTSLSPRGLYVEGRWFVHDYVRSATKIWFMEAR